MHFNPDGQMYELYAAVAAIRVEGKSYDDICTRVPIADIFHSTRRGRRDAVLTEALTPLQASPPPPPPFSSTDTPPPPPTLPAATLKAGGGNVTTAINEDLYDTLWADYDYDFDVKVAAEAAAARVRIDFEKFGGGAGGKERDGASDLPKDIYCDLVDSLRDLCLQTNLLEIWRYDRVRKFSLLREKDLRCRI